MGQNKQQGGHAPISENQAITLGEKLAAALGALSARQAELEAVLPPDMTFAKFHATINQALRANPELLDCTPRSLINACVKAAYDGLRVDGKEAAIVWEIATVRTRGAPDRKEKQARYMPMYQGLCQQLYRGGLVLSCEAHVIHEFDAYDVEFTRDPPVRHRPLLTGERGKAIAVYNIARLASGARTFALMTRDEVIDVQKESRSGWDDQKGSKGVWARWEGEQWKKTVLRRHRKTLPVGREPIRDMEALDEFPQFDKTLPHPALAGAAPPRPTRDALEHQPDNGWRPNFDDERETVTVDAGREQDVQEQRQGAGGAGAAQRGPEIPDGPTEWALWERDVTAAIAGAATSAALDTIHRDANPVLNEAPRPVQGRIDNLFTDRAADFAAGPDDGAAADGRANDTAAGDR